MSNQTARKLSEFIRTMAKDLRSQTEETTAVQNWKNNSNRDNVANMFIHISFIFIIKLKNKTTQFNKFLWRMPGRNWLY